MAESLCRALTPDQEELLRDESRMTGHADTFSFPKTEGEIQAVLEKLHPEKTPVTFQGARTGITGGAVPPRGHVMNLSRMDRVLGLRQDPGGQRWFLKVQPGLPLCALREQLVEKKWETEGWSPESREALERFQQAGPFFFPADVTETSAAVGGMAVTNASGALSFRYGSTRHSVQSARWVLANGEVLHLERNRDMTQGRNFSVKTVSGKTLSGSLPPHVMPSVKNVAGYYARENMDLLDAFLGSDGTLAALSELEIILLPAPACRWAITAFLPAEEAALAYVRQLRESPEEQRPVALEFFNANALKLLRKMQKENPAFQDLPEIGDGPLTAIYAEFHGPDEEALEEAVMEAAEKLENCGGDPEVTWSASEPAEFERLHRFRHAVPEAVNLRLDENRKECPGLRKLGTDMAAPDDTLEKMMALYREDLEASGLESVIFGHIGNNHVHVNLIPRSEEEYGQGQQLYRKWAEALVGWGGTVAAEHGVGKLKAPFLRAMFSPEELEAMTGFKRLFDPFMQIGPDNWFQEVS